MRTSIVGIGCVLACGLSATARADEISIVEDYSLTGTGDVTTQWVPLHDTVPMSRDEFYRATGNADLAARDHHKRVGAGVAFVGSLAAFTFGAIELTRGSNEPAATGGIIGLGCLAFGVYELVTTTRMTALDARTAASRYNAAHVAPYATTDGGGVMVRGTFK